MAEQKAVALRRGAELIDVGERAISTGGWRVPLVEEHLRVHLGYGPSRTWCTVECLARTFFGRNTPTHRAAVRRRLSRLFRSMLMQHLFVVIEYAQGSGAHGQAISCKLFQREHEAERQYAFEQLRRMHQRRDLNRAQVAAAEALLTGEP